MFLDVYECLGLQNGKIENSRKLCVIFNLIKIIFNHKDRFFLLVDLHDFFFRFRVEETKKEALEMTSQLVISELFFFNISR